MMSARQAVGRWRFHIVLATALVAAAITFGSSSPAASVEDGAFVSVTPFRVADTSTGVGGSTTPIGAGATRNYSVLGQGGIPTTGVSAVVVDIAAISSTSSSPSSFRLWATGETMPSEASVLRFSASQIGVSNTAIVPVGTSGQISVWNNLGSTHFNLDVHGYFTSSASGSGFTPIAPTRKLWDETLVGGDDKDVQITGGSIPSTATAVFANIKVLTPLNGQVAGGIRIGAGGTDISTKPSAVNYPESGFTDVGLAIKLSSNGKIRLRNANSGGSPRVWVDVQGYFSGSGGGSFTPLNQGTLYNTADSTPIAADGTRTVNIANVAGLPDASEIGAVAVTIYAARWTTTGRISIYNPNMETPPESSNLSYNTTGMNASTGATTTAVLQPSIDGDLKIQNIGEGVVDVRLSVQGWFSVPPDPDAAEKTAELSAANSAPAPTITTVTPAPATADSGTTAAVANAKTVGLDLLNADTGIGQLPNASTSTRVQAVQNTDVGAEVGKVWANAAVSEQTSDWQVGLDAAASDPDYQSYTSNGMIISEWQGVTASSTSATITFTGTPKYLVSGDWQTGIKAQYKAALVKTSATSSFDGWRLASVSIIPEENPS